MNIDFNESELAVLNDALLHVESTTDIYEYIGSNTTREAYRAAFETTLNKVIEASTEDAKQGAMYFQR